MFQLPPDQGSEIYGNKFKLLNYFAAEFQRNVRYM
jgi:hypothetical protein